VKEHLFLFSGERQKEVFFPKRRVPFKILELSDPDTVLPPSLSHGFIASLALVKLAATERNGTQR
jgi:hypothetical protein